VSKSTLVNAPEECFRQVFISTVLLWVTQRLALGEAWAPLAISGELINPPVWYALSPWRLDRCRQQSLRVG
jgi:hypothetical protein